MKKNYEKPITQWEETLCEKGVLALSPMGEGGVWQQGGVDPNDPSDGTDEDGRGNINLVWDRMNDHF